MDAAAPAQALPGTQGRYEPVSKGCVDGQSILASAERHIQRVHGIRYAAGAGSMRMGLSTCAQVVYLPAAQAVGSPPSDLQQSRPWPFGRGLRGLRGVAPSRIPPTKLACHTQDPSTGTLADALTRPPRLGVPPARSDRHTSNIMEPFAAVRSRAHHASHTKATGASRTYQYQCRCTESRARAGLHKHETTAAAPRRGGGGRARESYTVPWYKSGGRFRFKLYRMRRVLPANGNA